MQTYDQLKSAIDKAITSLPDTRQGNSHGMGLLSLYSLAARGSINQITYIMDHAESLITYCLRKPRSYAELREHINRKVK